MQNLGKTPISAKLDFGNRKWHYDTRYFDTSIGTMKRVVVRVYLGDAKTKGNPVAQAVGFLGKAVAPTGSSNVDWTIGTTLPTPAGGTPAPGTNPPGTGTPTTPLPGTGTNPPGTGTPTTPTPTPTTP